METHSKKSSGNSSMSQPDKSKRPFRDFAYIRFWFFATLGFLVGTLGLAWFFYNGEYKFWHYYISDLGRIHIVGNSSITNLTSRIIFSVGLGICGVSALIMAQLYFRHPLKSRLTKTKGILLILLAVGAVLIGFPIDGQHPNVHRIGAALFFINFDLYIFFCQFTRVKQKQISFDTGEGKSLTFEKLVVIILFVWTITYLILIIIDLAEILPAVQKINVLLFLTAALMLDKEDF